MASAAALTFWVVPPSEPGWEDGQSADWQPRRKRFGFVTVLISIASYQNALHPGFNARRRHRLSTSPSLLRAKHVGEERDETS